MKKYFSWFALIMALPALYYICWSISDGLSSYNHCKANEAFLKTYNQSCGSFNSYFEFGIMGWTFIAFLFIYWAAWKVNKMPKGSSRTMGLVGVIILFIIAIGFDLAVWGLGSGLH